MAGVILLLVVAGVAISSAESSPPAATDDSTAAPPGPDTSAFPTPEITTPTPESSSTPKRTIPQTGLKRNSLYKIGALPKTSCPAPPTPNFRSHRQQKRLIKAVSRCLDQAWKDALGDAGLRWSSPDWRIIKGKGKGACGQFPPPSGVPYYCGRNNTIYGSTSGMARNYGRVTSYHGAIAGMMAHEYGHHVQFINGMGHARYRAEQGKSRGGRLAVSRRYELQANCLGGLFMRAVAGSYPLRGGGRSEVFRFFANIGDWRDGRPRDHGSPRNSGIWFKRGYQKNKASACNTWTAPKRLVS